MLHTYMYVYFIGVCGTGMASLAGLMKTLGHRVVGSDTAFDPPIGPKLEQWGVETRQGWNPANLEPVPDLIIVGNVCRRDNPEAQAAIESGAPYLSMPQALARYALKERSPVVVSGTHGKTTTTAIVAFLLQQLGKRPGYFIGGAPLNFTTSFAPGEPGAPFAIEGDEYDSAFFEKRPKFLSYRPEHAILTSVEYDHIDIYPDRETYEAAFRDFVKTLPKQGSLVAWAGDPAVRKIAAEAACKVVYYALDGDDCGEVKALWSAAIAEPSVGSTAFDLFGGGSFCGRVHTQLIGKHNLRNALAALAVCAEGFDADLKDLMTNLPNFRGVERRQELVAECKGITVYDDFAHHPSAVRETLAGLKMRYPGRRLIVAFEPRSATASRALHQAEYPAALGVADSISLAPVARKSIAQNKRLDTKRIADELRTLGKSAQAHESTQDLVEHIVAEAEPDDVIVTMSNGRFDDVKQRIVAGLATRSER